MNPSTTMKSVAMIIINSSKDMITGKRIFSETIQIEDKDLEASKRPKIDSNKETIKVQGRNMKENVQGTIVQVQEYKFSKARESSSSDRYKSRNDLYTRYGHDKKFSSEKALNVFPKVRDISDKEI